MKTEAFECRGMLRGYEAALRELEDRHESQAETKVLLDDLSLHRYLLSRVTSNQLGKQFFHALVEAKVYIHDVP